MWKTSKPTSWKIGLISLSKEAEDQLDRLRLFYEEKNRLEALLGLQATLNEASLKILSNPGKGLRAPRPYPSLASFGFLWIEVSSYWIAFDNTGAEPVITGIHHKTANIPGLMGA